MHELTAIRAGASRPKRTTYIHGTLLDAGYHSYIKGTMRLASAGLQLKLAKGQGSCEIEFGYPGNVYG